VFFFLVALGLNFWASTVGWHNPNLRGVEFRQAQTALSTYFIQKEHNYALAYPTPVLGKPWSIPLEFPLYQWTVAALSDASGCSLVATGRAVSLGCFYLTLPAVFLLLGRWRLTASRRLWILVALVSCPLYVFYGRSFLIETMALLASVWFLVAYLKAVETGRWSWIVAANLLGAVAGTVKVTTFMLYLALAAGWTLVRLWRAYGQADAERERGRREILVRGVAATLAAVGLVFAWMHFSDAVKRLNPSGEFMVSAKMRGYYFGTTGTRFSAAVWAGHWKIFREAVIWLPLAATALVLFAGVARRWWPQVLLCLGAFIGSQVLLPELYAWHEYYYVANALFLYVALGLVFTSLFDSRWPRWLPIVAMVGLVAGQGYFFRRQFFDQQAVVSEEGNDLTRTLREITGEAEVVIVDGEDWNSMIPYYARRRTLMLRAGVDHNEAELRAAFAALKGEPIGGLVTREVLPPDSLLIRLAVEYFGFNPRPMLKVPDHYLYFPDARWDDLYERLQKKPLHEVFWAPAPTGGLFAETLAEKWYEMNALKRYQTVYFKFMHPQPVRFFCRFGPLLNEPAGEPRFGAHPVTRLVFAVPAGARRLVTAAGISPGAYENVPMQDATDGVELKLALLRPGVPAEVIYTRWLNPRDVAADRGTVPITADFEMPAGAELELSVTAGPAGLDRRDWAYLGAVTIE